MHRRLFPLLAALALAAPLGAQSVPAAAGANSADPVELRLADGRLRVVNLYKLEDAALRETAGRPEAEVLDRLVRDVYAPYTVFWNGYLGDEAAFREWAVKLLAADHPVHARMDSLRAVGLDRRFVEGTAWIERETGRRPEGTWYIVFGPGWTDMGGMGEIGMVADFTRMRPDSAAIADILPHELTHQVHGVAAGRANDPDRGTVLDRIVSEGFASYVAWVYAAGRATPARALMFREPQWEWSVAHERELWEAAKKILASRERADIDLVGNRSRQLVAGAPGAAGYFLGFRIVQAYVAKHGADSWKEIYDLPVGAVVEGSGYGGR